MEEICPWFKKEFFIVSFTDKKVRDGIAQISSIVYNKYSNDPNPKLKDFMKLYQSIRKSINNIPYKDNKYFLMLRGDQIGELMDRVDIHRKELGEEMVELLYNTLKNVEFYIKIDDDGVNEFRLCE